MGVSVLILGRSGSGKSTSLRNFSKGEVGIFNVVGKPLPFRNALERVDHADYATIRKSLKANNKRAYVIDDANYLMAFHNFATAKQQGYGKFTDMALEFEQTLKAANETDQDTIVYFMMHPDYDEQGRMKPKTIGRMLDEKLCVEGMFPIVLVASADKDGYHFETRTDGLTPAKTPMGMFEEAVIENDLKAVDTTIREYWSMQGIEKAAKKAAASNQKEARQ